MEFVCIHPGPPPPPPPPPPSLTLRTPHSTPGRHPAPGTRQGSTAAAAIKSRYKGVKLVETSGFAADLLSSGYIAE